MFGRIPPLQWPSSSVAVRSSMQLFVPVPKQRNTREENQEIKAGELPGRPGMKT